MAEDTHPVAKRHWSDTLFAVAALFVSAVSLWVGIRTEDANEKLVAASTRPFLQIGIDNSTPEGVPFLKFNMINAGVGPAVIKSFELFYKGKPYHSGPQLLKSCCGLQPVGGPILPPSDKHTRLLTGTIQGMVLRAGEQESFIILPLHDDNVAQWNALDAARKVITYRTCYCSVLGECWLANLKGDLAAPGGLDPERVKECPVPAVAYTR
jgi:hypothetical protein